MMSPELQRLSDGSVRLVDLAPWFVGVILELPDLLDSDQPEVVSRRLYPDPSDDAEHQKDWDKLNIYKIRDTNKILVYYAGKDFTESLKQHLEE